ncbi:MAG: putative co-chaperone, DnaJ family [Pseudomonadota bacterium]
MSEIAAVAANRSGFNVAVVGGEGLNLQSNDFELFGLPEQFEVDAQQLEERWKALQTQIHPDKFAAQGQAAQRLSMQWSVRINEAYQRLKAPITRGAYLCELRGHPVRAEDNTAMPAAFLMQQMEWREALEEAAGDAGELQKLWVQTRTVQTQYLLDLAQALDEQGDAALAANGVRALMFIDKFSRSVAQRLDELDE